MLLSWMTLNYWDEPMYSEQFNNVNENAQFNSYHEMRHQVPFISEYVLGIVSNKY